MTLIPHEASLRTALDVFASPAAANTCTRTFSGYRTIKFSEELSSSVRTCSWRCKVEVNGVLCGLWAVHESS